MSRPDQQCGREPEPVMTLLGKRAWWMPKRLERVVPEVDIEGEAVMHGLKGASS